MATIKSYTDIEQSRKLAKILPLESADMAYYFWENNENIVTPHPFVLYGTEVKKGGMFTYLNCWSLAALLGVLPEIQGGKPAISLNDNYITYPRMSDLHTEADNLVDACYEMILKLHELKML